MNRKLSEKMTYIVIAFYNAGQELPIAQRREQIKPVYHNGHKGVRVNGRNVWGVTPRQFWKYCKCVN